MKLPSEETGPLNASDEKDGALLRSGIDPHRLSATGFGRPPRLFRPSGPPWFRQLTVGIALWIAASVSDHFGVVGPKVNMVLSLVVGLVIIQAACDALITATERLAARARWDHYVAGTLAEILSTVPEFVVIGFLVPVSPVAAVIIALVTIYNNSLVFSLYSYFLPKNHKGRFLMPVAITEAGTQLLIAGAAIGSILGLIMLTVTAHGGDKLYFAPHELILVAVVMWCVFGVYAHKLIRDYASEESRVHELLEFDEEQIEDRKRQVYEQVMRVPLWNIAFTFVIGIVAAFLGGERVSSFAQTAIQDLGLNEVTTAVMLAAFAGMSEYVIIWRAHRKGQHKIALANAFGGITQVMFLVLPFTLLAVGVYQLAMNPGHPELPLQFDISLTLLTILLFPTFFVLIALLEEDHTFGSLDTAIMTAVCLLIVLTLVTYGS